LKAFTKYILISALALPLAGCSVLSAIGAWLPFGLSVLDGVVAIAAPTNTTIAADGKAGEIIFNDLSSAVSAAEAAGAGQTGLTKVISELSSAISSLETILADFSAIGASIPSKDLGYVDASENLLIAALEGFQTEAAAQAGTSTSATSTASIAIDEGCFGFEPATAKGGPHAWANCDPSDPIDMTWDRDPQTGAVKPNPNAKRIKLGSFKRQYNAIAVKYGHPEKQLKLSVAEHLHLK
jgi:hypothetical protein